MKNDNKPNGNVSKQQKNDNILNDNKPNQQLKWIYILILELLITFAIITFLMVAVENEGFSDLYKPNYFFNILKNIIKSFSSKDQIYPWYSFFKALGYTFVLMVISLLFSITISLFLSFYLADMDIEKKKKNKKIGFFNNIMRFFLDLFLYVASVAPEFWLLIIFSVFIASKTIFLSTGDEITTISFSSKPILSNIELFFKCTFIPVMVLSIRFTAIFTSYLRSAIVKISKQEHIKFSILRRMKKKFIKKEILKGSIIDLLSNLTYELPAFITTTAIVERVYNWPGIGKMYLDYLDNRAISQIYGVSIVISLLTIIINFIIHIYLVHRNPRIERDTL